MEFSSILGQEMRNAVHVVYIKLQQVLHKHGFLGPAVQHWPDVTFSLSLFSILAFLQYSGKSAWRCVSPHLVMKELVSWHELLPANLFHESRAHLIFDVLALVWNGVPLETRCGWRKFAFIVLVLWFFSRWLEVAAAVLALNFSFGTQDLVHLCLKGFSGLVFALKVLVHHRATSPANFFKISMSPEMLVARAWLPQAHFTSYLCGILAGFTFVHAANVVSDDYGSSDTIRRLAELPMDGPGSAGREEESDEDGTYDETDDGTEGETYDETDNENETDNETGSDESDTSPWLCLECGHDENDASSLDCEMCSTPRGTELVFEDTKILLVFIILLSLTMLIWKTYMS